MGKISNLNRARKNTAKTDKPPKKHHLPYLEAPSGADWDIAMFGNPYPGNKYGHPWNLLSYEARLFCLASPEAAAALPEGADFKYAHKAFDELPLAVQDLACAAIVEISKGASFDIIAEIRQAVITYGRESNVTFT